MCFDLPILTAIKERTVENVNNDKFFRKNTSARIFTCILLCIPVIVAVILFATIDPDIVDEKAIESLTVTCDGTTSTFDQSNKEAIDAYSNATLKNTQEYGFVEEDLAGRVCYEVKFAETGGNEVLYLFYMSMDPADCVFKNQDDKYFKMDPEAAQALLVRPEFGNINTSRVIPSLSFTRGTSTITLTPSSYNWSYKGNDGAYIETSSESGKSNPTVNMSAENLGSFNFTVEPDKVEYEISNPAGNIAPSIGLLETLVESAEIKQEYLADTSLKMKIIATWNDLDGVEEDYFGVITYEFDVLYDIEPEYKLVNLGLRRGDFTVLKVKNFNKGETLEITSDIGLVSSSKVYHSGETGEEFVFIPLASDVAVGEHTITLKAQSGDTKQIKLTAREEKNAYDSVQVGVLDTSLQAAFSKSAVEEWHETVAKLTQDSAEVQYWKLGSAGKFGYPVEKTSADGLPTYGMKRKIMSTKSGEYVYDGMAMKANEGDGVKASEGGKVVFAGEIQLMGKLVAVDHGSGVITYYGHLSEINVKVGDTVEKGKTLGKAGSTGFACDNDPDGAKRTSMVYFGVSFGGVFIDPQSPCQWGINF